MKIFLKLRCISSFKRRKTAEIYIYYLFDGSRSFRKYYYPVPHSNRLRQVMGDKERRLFLLLYDCVTKTV